MDDVLAVTGAVSAGTAALSRGRPVVLVDDQGPAGPAEGVLVFAGSAATSEIVAFAVRYGSGFVRVALPREACDRLALPAMPGGGGRLRHRVAVDATGTGTGISARDRARTIAALADPSTTPVGLTRPGHVVPVLVPDDASALRTRDGAALALARLAARGAAAAVTELVSDARVGELMDASESQDFAEQFGLGLVTVDDVVAAHRPPLVVRDAEAVLPTEHGWWRTIGYRSEGSEHLALVHGDVWGADAVPVHVHRECLLGDAFGSRACRCGRDLSDATEQITAHGRGVVIYLRDSRVRWACARTAPDPGAVSDLVEAVLDDLGVHSAAPLPEVRHRAAGEQWYLAGTRPA